MLCERPMVNSCEIVFSCVQIMFIWLFTALNNEPSGFKEIMWIPSEQSCHFAFSVGKTDSHVSAKVFVVAASLNSLKS